MLKTHQDCKNRKLKTTEKLFQAKFRVQKLKYLLGNLGYILSPFWGEKTRHLAGRSLSNLANQSRFGFRQLI